MGMRWAGHVEHVGGVGNVKIWLENPKGSEFVETGRRWEDNVGMNLRAIGWVGVDWMLLTQDMDHWWFV
jgi:hypothetical protein